MLENLLRLRLQGFGLGVADFGSQPASMDRFTKLPLTKLKVHRDVLGREPRGARRQRDIDVVYLGFDFERLAPDAESRVRVRQEVGISDDEFMIGYVGNFASGKGHRQLIDAFGKILNEIPNARLFLAGRGATSDIEAAAEKVSKAKIIFAGWRDDIPACLNAMDVFVQPSLSEAFSQVLIEAMGTGLPVVATNVGGASEVIEHGVDGILVEPDGPDAIRREVVELFKNAEFRNEMAQKGMRSVHGRFTAEQMVERQMALYQKWMKEKNGA